MSSSGRLRSESSSTENGAEASRAARDCFKGALVCISVCLEQLQHVDAYALNSLNMPKLSVVCSTALPSTIIMTDSSSTAPATAITKVADAPEPSRARKARIDYSSNSPDEILASNRIVASPFQVSKHKKDAARNWDIFYKVGCSLLMSSEQTS